MLLLLLLLLLLPLPAPSSGATRGTWLQHGSSLHVAPAEMRRSS
jgi:hypothetical protein